MVFETDEVVSQIETICVSLQRIQTYVKKCCDVVVSQLKMIVKLYDAPDDPIWLWIDGERRVKFRLHLDFAKKQKQITIKLIPSINPWKISSILVLYETTKHYDQEDGVVLFEDARDTVKELADFLGMKITSRLLGYQYVLQNDSIAS